MHMVFFLNKNIVYLYCNIIAFCFFTGYLSKKIWLHLNRIDHNSLVREGSIHYPHFTNEEAKFG